MARNNYSYEKYQRELAKKKKKEAKRLKKLNRAAGIEEGNPETISEDEEKADNEIETEES
jgi:transposase